MINYSSSNLSRLFQSLYNTLRIRKVCRKEIAIKEEKNLNVEIGNIQINKGCVWQHGVFCRGPCAKLTQKIPKYFVKNHSHGCSISSFPCLSKLLTPFFSLVNVAAAFDTWTTVCEDYATQLEQEGQYHKAATYLLAAHKVYSAIDLFKRHRLFK